MKGNMSIVRHLLQRRFSSFLSSSSSFSRFSALSSSARSLILAPNSMSSQIARNSLYATSNIGASTEFNFSNTSLPYRRRLCSAAGGNRSIGSAGFRENGVVIVKSEKEFRDAMNKAQDGSSPSIFYFTAVWCGPCRFISPVIVELSKQYPDVTTYKVDIDEEGLSSTIGELNITAVPTLHFFKEGSKKAEVVGADVAKLKSHMEQLYK